MTPVNPSGSPDPIKKKRENFAAKHLYRPLSEPIAMFLAKFGVSPNTVTTFSIFLSIISGCLFTPGELGYSILGALFLQLAVLTDHVDGNLARYTQNLTAFGQLWDDLANKQIRFFTLLGMSYGAYVQTGQPLILLIGSIAIFNFIYISHINYVKKVIPGALEKTILPDTSKGRFPNALALYAIMTLGGLTNQLWFPLVFLATVGFIWIKTIHNVYKTSQENSPKNPKES